MFYHTADGVPYWDESVYYQFSSQEIDALEAATYALDALCLDAVQYAIDHDLLHRFLVPPQYHDLIRRSWEEDEHTIYGRFDLAMDEGRLPKLLGIQRRYADRLAGGRRHPVVLAAGSLSRFRAVQFDPRATVGGLQGLRAQGGQRFYFAAVAGCLEDYMTVNYLRNVAIQAGFDTAYLDVEKVGWHARRRVFTDLSENEIKLCFKLYPWEWMFSDAFGPHLLEAECRWFEPPWKALLSNKAILPLLWELNPRHPNLLETSFEPLPGGNYVKKPILGREGANIQIFESGKLFLENSGPYDGPAVYQEICPLPRFDDRFFALIGSWLVNGWACGIGIREDESLITGNLSRFVPHVFCQ